MLRPSRPPALTRESNHAVAGRHFEQRFGRGPLDAGDPRATVNDFLFHRMIDPDWSPLQRAFVDKEIAKIEACRLHPGLNVPETLLVVPMAAVRSVDHLHDLLRPFIGTDAIAKPAHASGAATFLRDVAGPADLRPLHDLAAIDYAEILREMQYRNLPKKIIVETLVPAVTAASPDDYKFHCVHGEPLVCQVDHSRFGTGWSRLFGVPDFLPMDAADGLQPPPSFAMAAPDRIAAMIAAARALAAPFDFVRVDLYNGADGIYFGELTFTPAAALGIAPSAAGDHRVNATHRVYSGIVMTAIARARDRTDAAC